MTIFSSIKKNIPLIVGHRGAMEICPENTKTSFDTALANDIYGIELDIQLTKDNIPIIFHDKTLKKIGYPFKRIAGILSSEISSFRYYFNGKKTDQQILTLDEVLTLYAKKTYLFLEIKIRGGFLKSYDHHIKLTTTVLDIIKKQNLKDRVAILCFYPEIIQFAKRYFPGIRYIHNVENSGQWEKIKSYMDDAYAVCFDINFVKKNMVDTIHDQGKLVLTYACNTPAETDKALNFGIDILLGNNPAWLLSYLKEAKKLKSKEAGK